MLGVRERYRRRPARAASASDLQRVLYHQTPRHRYGAVHQPLDRGIALRSLVGWEQLSTRREFLFHATVQSAGARLTPRSSAQRSTPTPISGPQSIGGRLALGVLVERCMKTAMTLSLPVDAY